MKNALPVNLRSASLSLLIVIGAFASGYAQCSTGTAPSYSNSCTNDYFSSITATGTGVTSTITLTGSSCIGTYVNDFLTQGITASTGTTVTMHVARNPSTYTAYVTVYVDWNNDGIYETTELSGTMLTISSGTLAGMYNFTIPTTGVVSGTNLHMRLMLSEITSGAPCTASWGETADFYCNVTCPAITMTVSPSPGTICAGGAGLPLTASGAGTGGTYTWTPAPGLSATTGATVTATPTVTTVYTVTGTSSGGCHGSATDTISITPVGTALINPSGHPSLCSDSSITFTTPIITGSNYQWFLGGLVIAGATNNTYATSVPGSYTVRVTLPGGCRDSSVASVLTVHTVPVPVVTYSMGVFRTGNYYTSYQWSENGVNISGATHDSVIAHSNGTYSVTVTDTNGCKGVSAGYVLTKVGVSTIIGGADISVYPNPSGNWIHIDAPIALNAVIYSADGKMVASRKAASSMDISALNPGLYILELFDEEGNRVHVQKLVKN